MPNAPKNAGQAPAVKSGAVPFEEALKKLVEWCDTKKLDTWAIDEFRKLRSNGHFPGLGVIKKLSILNHLELVLNII